MWLFYFIRNIKLYEFDILVFDFNSVVFTRLYVYTLLLKQEIFSNTVYTYIFIVFKHADLINMILYIYIK